MGVCCYCLKLFDFVDDLSRKFVLKTNLYLKSNVIVLFFYNIQNIRFAVCKTIFLSLKSGIFYTIPALIFRSSFYFQTPRRVKKSGTVDYSVSVHRPTCLHLAVVSICDTTR